VIYPLTPPQNAYVLKLLKAIFLLLTYLEVVIFNADYLTTFIDFIYFM